MTEKVEIVTNPGTVAEQTHNLDRLVAQGVEGVAGLVAVPEKRAGNLVIPGSHGELHAVGKKSSPNVLVLPMWVRGVNPDGTVPADDGARLLFHDNLRTLIGLFTEGEQIVVRHTLTDGSAREILGEVTDAITPEVVGADRWTLGRFSVAVNCADPFWADVDPATSLVSLTSGATAALTEFGGASAPMEDLTITYAGISNPRLTQPSTGVYQQLNRVVGGGQTVTVNTATWQVSGTGGVGPGLYEDIEYGGRRTSRWFALHPEPGGGAPVVRLDHTGGGVASVTVTGKRKHRIA